MKTESRFSELRQLHYLTTVIYRPFSRFIYIGLIIFSVFAFIDIMTLGPPAYPIVAVRLLFCAMCALFFVRFREKNIGLIHRFEVTIVVTATLIVIWVCLAAIAQGNSDYQSGVILMMVYMGTFSRLPIKESFIALTIMLVSYTALVSPALRELDSGKEAHQLSILITTYVMCVISCARRELEVKLRYKQFRTIRAQEIQLKARSKLMEKLSITDPLTQFYNRQYLDSHIVPSLPRFENFGVIMLDIDHFKQVNDQYGHQVGDNVIVEVTTIISQSLDESQKAIRYGGEEFVLIIPNTNRKDIWVLAEEIRTKIEAHTIASLTTNVTISIGIGFTSNEKQYIDHMIKLADQALYQSKSDGRNRTTFH